LENELTTRVKSPLLIVWRFLIHMIVGTILFASVAGATLLLSYFVKLMDSIGVPWELVQVTIALKYVMIAIDLMLFAVFLVRAFVAAVKDFWRGEWRS
jgi:hypothetical protein